MTRVVAVLLFVSTISSLAHANGRFTKAYPTADAAAQAEGTRRLNQSATVRSFEGKLQDSQTTVERVGRDSYQVSGLRSGSPAYATTVRVLSLKDGEFKAWKSSSSGRVFNLRPQPRR